jgi:hypothetical protein
MALVVVFLTSPVTAQVEMTPDRTQEALVDEKATGCYQLKQLGCFTTPYSRVAGLAKEARRRYESLSQSDIPPAALEPVLEVVASPRMALGGRMMLSVEAVVVMPKGSKDRAQAIKPISTADLDQTYQTLLGATFEARGLVARFPLGVLDDRYEVRVVYNGAPCQDWRARPSTECAAGLRSKGIK